MTDSLTTARTCDAAPTVPGYHVLRPLGSGASSTVWAAQPDGVDTSEVALKVVRAGPDADRELALLRAVRHPHALGLLDVVQLADSRLALVTQLLDGGTLAAAVAARGRLRPGEVVTVLAPLAQAVADLHAAGIQHGDLAPGNVLFDRSGRPHLADLGTVRLTGAPRAEVFGTAGFVDPVLFTGGSPGPASDVYGLGALAWFALCGAPPEVLMCRGPLAELAPTASAELVDAVQSALDPEPTRRPAPADLARALHAGAVAEPVWRPGASPSEGGLTRRVLAAEPDPEAGPRHREQRRRWGRSGWGRGGPAVAVLAATVGLAAVALLCWPPGQGPGAQLAPGPVASPPQPIALRAGVDALPVVRQLAAARVAAFNQPPRSCSGATAGPGTAGAATGSPADRQDQLVLADLAVRCLRFRGWALEPRQARVVAADAGRATVDVVVDESAYDVIDADGAVVHHAAAVTGRRSRLTVVRTSAGWRVFGVSPSPMPPPAASSGARR